MLHEPIFHYFFSYHFPVIRSLPHKLWESEVSCTLKKCNEKSNSRNLNLWSCLFGFLTSSSSNRLYRRRFPRLMSNSFTCCHKRDRVGDHDFCLSQSDYTDINPTSKERMATAGIEPRTFQPGVARFTDSAESLVRRKIWMGVIKFEWMAGLVKCDFKLGKFKRFPALV